eukprot:748081-Hanusia_phi.AAC.4
MANNGDAQKVKVFPRRKRLFAETARAHLGERSPEVEVDILVLENLYGMKQISAARSLGISLTCFKGVCRRLGLKKWPYEKPSQASSENSSRRQGRAEGPESSDSESATSMMDADQVEEVDDGRQDDQNMQMDCQGSSSCAERILVDKGIKDQAHSASGISFDREWVRWYVQIADSYDDEMMPAPSLWCDFCKQRHSQSA